MKMLTIIEGKIELKERGSEVLKFNNSLLLSMECLLEAIYRNKVVEVDGVKNLEGEVEALSKDMGLSKSAIKQLFDVKGNLSSSKKIGGKDSYVS